jgi:hypothetical protein
MAPGIFLVMAPAAAIVRPFEAELRKSCPALEHAWGIPIACT